MPGYCFLLSSTCSAIRSGTRCATGIGWYGEPCQHGWLTPTVHSLHLLLHGLVADVSSLPAGLAPPCRRLPAAPRSPCSPRRSATPHSSPAACRCRSRSGRAPTARSRRGSGPRWPGPRTGVLLYLDVLQPHAEGHEQRHHDQRHAEYTGPSMPGSPRPSCSPADERPSRPAAHPSSLASQCPPTPRADQEPDDRAPAVTEPRLCVAPGGPGRRAHCGSGTAARPGRGAGRSSASGRAARGPRRLAARCSRGGPDCRRRAASRILLRQHAAWRRSWRSAPARTSHCRGGTSGQPWAGNGAAAGCAAGTGARPSAGKLMPSALRPVRSSWPVPCRPTPRSPVPVRTEPRSGQAAQRRSVRAGV